MHRPRPTPHHCCKRSRAPAVALLLVLSLFAASACQYDRESRLAEIRALHAGGQFEESIAPLRVFLTADADHAEANYRLGVALVQTGRPTLAVWPLQKATESEGFQVPAGLLLASALLATGSFEEAIRAADKVLTAEPDRVAALNTRARASISSGQPDEALIDADRILELRAEDFTGNTLKVGALLDLGRPEEAEKLHTELWRSADEAGDTNDAARACGLLARFYGSRGELDKTEETMLACVERYPSHPLVQQYASDFFRWVEQPEKAIDLWRKAVAEAPQDIGLRSKLGQVLYDSSMPEEAEKVYVETAELFDTPQAWQLLSIFYRDNDRPTDARRATEMAIEKAGSQPAELLFVLADLLILEGNYERAEEIAMGMKEQSYRSLIRGSIKLAQDDPAGALALLETGLRLWPNHAGARYLAGNAALRMGDLQRALAEYREATRIDPKATDAALAMARIYLALRKYPAAMQFAMRHTKERPFVSEDSYVIAIRSSAEQGLWAQAVVMLDELEALPGMRRVAVVERAGVARKKDGTDAAIGVVRETELDLSDVANASVLTSLCFDLIAAGRQDEALRLVDQALAKHPEDPQLLDLRARQLARQGRGDEALVAAEKALSADPDFAPALEVKAVFAEQSGKLEESLALYDRAASADPENADYGYGAARVALLLGGPAECIDRLAQVISISPGHVAAVNDLAWHLAEQGKDLDRALELAERAIQLDAQAETLDTLGFVRLKRGETDAAVKAFEASLSARPASPSVRYRLAMAQSQAGDAAAARTNLAKALEEETFPEEQAARAELARLESN